MKLKKYQQQFAEETYIPYPEFWGGYRIQPIEFEFWHGRNHHLHDRVHYFYAKNVWKKQALAP